MSTIGVNIAIIDQGRVLLTQREDFEVWCLPGGQVDDGECITQAAIRETKEEVGLEVELVRLVGLYDLNPATVIGSNQIAVFTARPIGGELTLQANEVLDAGYFAADRLPSLLLFGHQQRIQDALHGATGLVRTQPRPWPFEADLTRQELYTLRDQSGLSRQAFYLKYFL